MSRACRMCREGNHPACSGILCSCTVTARCRANAALVDERKIIKAIVLCVLAPLIILLALIVPRAQRVDSVSESAVARVVAIPPVATTQARLTHRVRENTRVRAMSADSESFTTTPTDPRGVFHALGDCESGEWAREGDPTSAVPGSVRWDLASDGYEGGLRWLPSTWARAGGHVYALHAYDATADQQITVARHWLARTSVLQWPTCGSAVGLSMADAL